MYWTDFRNLFTIWTHFTCQWSNWTSFSDISRDVTMATDFMQKMANSAISTLWLSETEWDNAVYAWLNSATNATISCKIMVKISPVVSVQNILIEIMLRVHVLVRHISSNICGCPGPILTIVSPYDFTLRADAGCWPLFPISQGTLPWQPNNIAVMKVNWYYVHSLQFARW